MKLFHISDLHLGKRIYEFSMLEEQRELLLEILRSIDEEQPQALLISGDIYDKPVPPTEAVKLLDDFLTASNLAGIAFGNAPFRNPFTSVAGFPFFLPDGEI